MKFYFSALLLCVAMIGYAQDPLDFRKENLVPNYTFIYPTLMEKLEKAFYQDAPFAPEELSTDIAMYTEYADPQKTVKTKDGYTLFTTELSDNYLAKTSFKGNVIDGKKQIVDRSENLIQEIPYSRGQLTGIAKTFDRYGNLLTETTYRNGKKDGLKKSSFKGDRHRSEEGDYEIKGNYIAGKLEGRLTLTTSDLTILYPSDFKKGEVTVYVNKDNLWITYGIAESGLKHGRYTQYGVNPNTKQQFKIIIADYYLGDFHGRVEKYNNEGILLVKNKYNYGIPVGEHTYYSNKGVLLSESNYDDEGNSAGVWRSFDGTGKKMSEARYDKEKNEFYKEEFQKGFLLKKEFFTYNKLDGKAQYFDTLGNLTSEAFYQNGTYTKEIAYFKSGKIKYEYVLHQSKTYYNKEGVAIWTNKYLNGKEIGEHQTISYDSTDNHYTYSTEAFDNKGNKTQTILYRVQGKEYLKIPWRNHQKHGVGAEKEQNEREKPVYYFEGGRVSKEEYESRSRK